MANTRPTPKAEFGKTASDYAEHREGFPASFFAAMEARGIGLPGQRLVDLGTGTGTIARGMARGMAGGPARAGATVTGLDADPQMLEKAKELAAAEGLAITFLEAKAEATGLPAASADVVTAGQCWHWFDHAKACAEVARLLTPEGRLAIAHYDWLPLKGNVIGATERLILEFNPDWRGARGLGAYPLWLRQLGDAGFLDLQTFSYDEPTTYSHEGWRGRIRASAGIAALEPEKRTAFDQALKSLLKQDFAREPLATPHRVWVLLARPPMAEEGV